METPNENVTVAEWLAIRKEAALLIDPETSEIICLYRQMFDPYALGLDIPEDCDQINREFFARSPGSDVWVWFGDLPEQVQEQIWERLARPRELSALTGDSF